MFLGFHNITLEMTFSQYSLGATNSSGSSPENIMKDYGRFEAA